MATRDFGSVEKVKEDSQKLVLRYDLDGFKPSQPGHSCHAKKSSDTEVIVEACMDGEKYLADVKINAREVTCKPSKNVIEVHIKKA